MRTLAIEGAALKDIAALQTKQYRQVVSAIFDLLKEPRPHYSKPLAGSHYLRLALGEYRVIYRFDAAAVDVALFGKRYDDEIYRMMKLKVQ